MLTGEPARRAGELLSAESMAPSAAASDACSSQNRAVTASMRCARRTWNTIVDVDGTPDISQSLQYDPGLRHGPSAQTGMLVVR